MSDQEVNLIANIARYHRKSTPKKKHSNYNTLSTKNKRTVSILSAILRIAEGIDRRQLQLVDDLEVKISEKIEILFISSKNAVKPEIELWQANRRKKILEKIIKKSIFFKI
jgi:exopolyphosphatase/guanosine-5'-triphosphate,3'-diphosphate pyrophosphatase